MMSAATMLGVIQLLVGQFAAFLAALLLVSGLHKLIRRHHLQTVVHEFAGVPRYLAPFTVVGVALCELLASLLLWTPSYRAVGGLLAALIWGVYLALILHAIAQGRRDVDCGCTFGAAHRPLGVFQVGRNAVLAGTAMLVATGSAASVTWGSAASVTGAFVTSQIVAAFALLALYGALDQVMALRPLRRGGLR